MSKKVLDALTAKHASAVERTESQHGDEIALCLFDVVMPRLGGREALEVIRAHRPAARALLMSGFVPDDGGGRPGVGNVTLLSKPFAPRELLRQIRETLDR